MLLHACNNIRFLSHSMCMCVMFIIMFFMHHMCKYMCGLKGNLKCSWCAQSRKIQYVAISNYYYPDYPALQANTETDCCKGIQQPEANLR